MLTIWAGLAGRYAVDVINGATYWDEMAHNLWFISPDKWRYRVNADRYLLPVNIGDDIRMSIAVLGWKLIVPVLISAGRE